MKPFSLILASLGLALLLVTGCQSPLTGLSSQGGLKVTLANHLVDRTLNPFAGEAKLALATVDFTLTDPSGTFHSYEKGAGQDLEVPDAAAGTWTIDALAKNADGAILGRGHLTVDVTAGQVNLATLTLAPSGTGSLQVVLDWTGNALIPANPDLTISLTRGTDAPVVLTPVFTSHGATLTLADQPSGEYRLLLQMRNAGGKLVYGKRETAYLFEGRTTPWNLSIAPADMNAAPETAPVWGGRQVRDTRISLAWFNSTGRTENFTIQRKIGTGDWTDLITLVSSANEYTDGRESPLTAGQLYTYRVRSENDFGPGPWSTELVLTTPVVELWTGDLSHITVAAGPVTWTKNKTYVVETLVIEAGATLVIEPGVTVLVKPSDYPGAPESEIIVNGTLLAQGTDLEPITIQGTGEPAYEWGALRINDSSTDAVFDAAGVYQSGTVLQHVTLRNARGVQIDGAAPWLTYFDYQQIQDRYFDDFPRFGFSDSSTTSRVNFFWGVTDLRVLRADHLTLAIRWSISFKLSSASLHLSNSLISTSLGVGYGSNGLDNQWSNVKLTSNWWASYFYGSGKTMANQVQWITNDAYEENVVVRGGHQLVAQNSLWENGWQCLRVFEGSQVSIRNSSMVQISTFPVREYSWWDRSRYIYADGASVISVLDSTLSKSLSTDWAIQIRDGSSFNMQRSVVKGGATGVHLYGIQNSTLLDNRFEGNSGPSLYIERSGPVTVARNTFASNSGGSVVQVYDSQTARFYNNSFDNPSAIRQLANLHASPFNASGNWWGSAAASTVRNGLQDFYDDPTKGVVTYQPYLDSAPDLTQAGGVVQPRITGPSGTWLPAGTTTLALDWVGTADQVEAVVSDTADFSHTLSTQTLSTNNLSLPALTTGDYYLKLTPSTAGKAGSARVWKLAVDPIVEIKGNRYATKARTTAGRLLTWGANDANRLGRYGNNGVVPAFAWGTVQGQVKQLGSSWGESNNAVLDQAGQPWFWGNDYSTSWSYGLTGTVNNDWNATGDLSSPSNVRLATPNPAFGANLVSINQSYRHTYALRADGTVWVAGYNEPQWMGLNGARAQTPTAIPGLTGVAEVAAGESFTLVRKTDGTVWTWGYNGQGQLGLGDRTERAVPTQVPILSPSLIQDLAVTSPNYPNVQNGSYEDTQTFTLPGASTVAVYFDDFAVYPPYGGYVEILDGTDAVVATYTGELNNFWSISVPGTTLKVHYRLTGNGSGWRGWSLTAIADPNSTQVPLVKVWAGASFAAAKDANGKMWTWGSANSNAALGTNNGSDRPTPTVVTSLNGLTQMSLGYNHGLGLKADGTVVSWGYNDRGHLGVGDTTIRWLPTPVPGLSNIVQVEAKYGYSEALDADGKVYVWGWNHYNTLGMPEQPEHILTPTLLPIPTLELY